VPFYEFEEKTPVLDPSCFVHPDAILIGDVTIGKHCFIGAGAVLRGDYGSIVISDGANVQENCTLHAQPGSVAFIGANVDVGHGCIIHGPCAIGSNVTIGMGSTICDNCQIGDNCFIGAGSVLPSKLVIPDGKLAFGNPAKVIKDTNEYQRTFTKMAIDVYKDLCERYRKSFKLIEDATRLYRG